MQDIGGGKVRGDRRGGGGIGPGRGTCGSRLSGAVYRVRANEECHLVFVSSYLSLNPEALRKLKSDNQIA
jgi:hypothetical protein